MRTEVCTAGSEMFEETLRPWLLAISSIPKLHILRFLNNKFWSRLDDSQIISFFYVEILGEASRYDKSYCCIAKNRLGFPIFWLFVINGYSHYL